ncbi:MAG: zinc metallopeptidase [Pseudomonadota bacterium]
MPLHFILTRQFITVIIYELSKVPRAAILTDKIRSLPVEFDASRRAMDHLERMGILVDDAELDGARQVLRAAAWTYVAAAVAAIGSWAMYLLLSRRR